MKLEDVLHRAPVLPVLTVPSADLAVPLAKALVAGGCSVIEVTLRTDDALESVKRIHAELPDVVVGVGTVRTPEDLERVSGAGAKFAVSPGVTPTLARKAQAFPLWFIPGVATPSEAMVALEEGFDVLKLFPAAALGGPDVLRAMAGPLPTAKFCPTGGIRPDDVGEYLALDNVVCVGGSWIAPPGAVREERWDLITENTRDAFARARAAGWSPREPTS